MSDIRVKPCSACPYKKSTPSGVWDYDEYEKLRFYDAPTHEQPFGLFMCHASTEFCCAGWAQVHTSRGHEFDLIALRLRPPGNEIPEPSTEMFASGNEAADWGQELADAPPDEAIATIEKLTKQHARLQRG